MNFLTTENLNALIHSLHAKGYRVIGPRKEGTAIVPGDVKDIADLPAGWNDVQSPGQYRVRQNEKAGPFSHTVGPLNWKRFLFRPQRTLIRSKRSGKDLAFEIGDDVPQPPLAFLGIRPCDLSALAILDKVFLGPEYQDPQYAEARKRLFIVAANCTEPGGTCFCASMGTGPRATAGYDLCLTEISSGSGIGFLCDAGSDRGRGVLQTIGSSPAEASMEQEADRSLEAAAGRMGRSLDTDGLSEFLMKSYDDPRWEQTGDRCLTCANCTMVCPTCFCSTMDDLTDLSGDDATRQRRWDSCFTLEFSYIHGGSVRRSASSRYRQWLMHKLGTWKAQFGTFGCVGCGRCITWCPVGIDITHEIEALRKHSHVSPHEHNGE